MKRSLLTLCLLTLGPASPLLAGPEIEPLRAIAIQDGGRAKPLDSFARDLAKRVQGARPFGLDRVEGLEPTEWVLALLAKPEDWRDRPIIKVTHAGLRDVALSAGGPRPLQPERARRARWPAQGARGRTVQERARTRTSTPSTARSPRSTTRSRRWPVSCPARRCASCRTRTIRRRPGSRWPTSAPPRRRRSQRVRTLVAALVAAYRDGDRAGRRDGRLRAREEARGVRPRRLSEREGPRDGGPLQLAQAVPQRVGALPRGLPAAARELPARLASRNDRGLRRHRRGLRTDLLRDAAPDPDLRAAAGHEHVRDDRLRVVGRRPVRPRVRGHLPGALLRAPAPRPWRRSPS